MVIVYHICFWKLDYSQHIKGLSNTNLETAAAVEAMALMGREHTNACRV